MPSASAGWSWRCRWLAPPQLLLLDEPMAGMSADDPRGMVALLERLRGQRAMLLVEHDMDAAFRRGGQDVAR